MIVKPLRVAAGEEDEDDDDRHVNDCTGELPELVTVTAEGPNQFTIDLTEVR